MKRVYLVGGTHDGEIVNVKHGNQVLMPRRNSVPPPDRYSTDPVAMSPLSLETYAPPASGVTIINGVERWLLVRQSAAYHKQHFRCSRPCQESGSRAL